MKRLRTRSKRERWISKSKELRGTSFDDPGRNPNFDSEETKLLISLWGDPVFQKTLITTHRKHKVIVQLAEQMSEYGYNRTPGELNTRIKNLKCFYNRLKKDIDAGSKESVSWKHFNAMDEIMTRSIFSVRPNEVPKPSIRYQIEMAKARNEERKKRKAAKYAAQKSYSTNANHSDSSSISSKSETLFDEDDVRILKSDHDERGVVMTFTENDESVSVKTEIEEDTVLKPIEECSDGNAELEICSNRTNNNPETQAPILSEYIQVAPNTSSSSGSLFSNCIKTVNANPKSLLKTCQASTTIPQSIVFANQPVNGLASQGKISLVPTNFLLQQNNKPQTHQIQTRPQPQQRIICTQPNGQANGNIVSTPGNGRMKVLFVNAFQNGKTTNGATTKEVPFTNLVNTSHTHQTDPGIPMNITENPKPTRVEEPVSIKDQGLELLFTKLIGMQNENNEIQKQRLEIERQRLEFEKSMANKLLEALVSLKPIQTEENTKTSNSRKRSANPEDLPNDIVDNFDDFPLLTPKIEKID